MIVDVTTEADIDRPVTEVATNAADPATRREWYANIVSIEWKTSPPLEVGSAVAFIAHFLGRRFEYTYEIIEYVPNERLVMRTQQGPFPMETTYTWTQRRNGSTHMTLRNRGKPAGFSKLIAPIMKPAMRRANRKDLAKLTSILEAAGWLDGGPSPAARRAARARRGVGRQRRAHGQDPGVAGGHRDPVGRYADARARRMAQ